MGISSSDFTNISIVVNLLKENHIRHIIINPGGTNITFVKAIQDDDFFTCYSIVDERSAVYFAIGLYLHTGEVIALSCTSAQATRNYIPGLTEAYYKHVPILAITMEKHPRYLYQDYMQAPDQTSLPNDAVKKSYELPFISDFNDVIHSMRLANEAMMEVIHNGCGPVQLCIPWLDFPQDYKNLNLKCIRRYDTENNWSDISLDGKKILLVIGEHRTFTDELTDLIDSFTSAYNVVVYKNHLSNFHGRYCVDANLALSVIRYEDYVATYSPDLIISIGGQTGDYPLFKMLSRESDTVVEHWSVRKDGNVVDTYDKLTKIFQCGEDFFFKHFLKHGELKEHSFYILWKQLVDSMSTDIILPYSNAYAAQQLHNLIPDNSYMQFAILNSLRVWSLFPLKPTVSCFSNVGAFGIDGGLSTLIGISMETEQLCFMIIGDLSFFYDMNSLGIRHIKNNLRILLINNNGGIEFKLNARNNSSTDRFIAAANHFKNAKGWAETCGFKYISSRNKEEFDDNVELFVGNSERPVLMELFVSDLDEAESYRMLLDYNRKYDIKDSIKRGIKTLIKGL